MEEVRDNIEQVFLNSFKETCKFLKTDNENAFLEDSFTGIVRAVRGTTRAAHSTGATVTNYSGFSGWGQAATSTDKVAEPGMWSIDNFIIIF